MNQSLIFIGYDPGVNDGNSVSLFELHPDGRLTILSNHPSDNAAIDDKIKRLKEYYYPTETLKDESG